MKATQPDIFISYAHKNGEIAASLASQLDDLGLKVFLAERNLHPGEHWEPAIRIALRDAKLVLCLITPESKSSSWVHAEAGAAWVLEKPILPALRSVDPSELIEILRLPHGRRIETAEQVEGLLDDICKRFSIARLPIRFGSNEILNSNEGWNAALKIGAWSRDTEEHLIVGRGMHNYLLSSNHYSGQFTINAVIRFNDLHAVNRLDAVNAGIIIGWTTPRSVRRYFNLLMNEERMFLELIGDRGGDAYEDYQHIDDGIPFRLVEDATYAVTIAVNNRHLSATVRGPVDQWSYSVTLPESPIGRVGIRPWRSRIECERFDVHQQSSG